MKTYIIAILLPCFAMAYCQTTDFDRGLQVSSILIQGLSAMKGSKKAKDPNAKTVESICIKNKLPEKLTFKFSAKIEDEDYKKELVVQKESKECLYDVRKGVWQYEILYPNQETYKKGEMKIEEELEMTIKTQ